MKTNSIMTLSGCETLWMTFIAKVMNYTSVTLRGTDFIHPLKSNWDQLITVIAKMARRSEVNSGKTLAGLVCKLY